jgi:alpha-methylacyl-CoA racemase
LLFLCFALNFFDCSRRWGETREIFAGIFKQKTQADWSKVFDGTDACVTPVLRPEQLHEHPLHIARSAADSETL